MSLEEHYPTSCPFCAISKAYPPENGAMIPKSPDPTLVSPQCHLILSTPQVVAFLDILPISPGHVLLTTREHYEKLASVRCAPAATRPMLWQGKAVDEGSTPAAAIGFWMPLLSRMLTRVLEVEDWNVVQNNGARAAQVVPHVHFHFIPRYQEGREEVNRGDAGKGGNVDWGMLKSWKMFGRGKREELDDDEAVELSKRLREGLRAEIDALLKSKL